MAIRKENKLTVENKSSADAPFAKPSLPLIGLLAVEMIIGYEWFISGLVKFVRGDFPSGLAEELAEKSEGLIGWYADFLNGVVIPSASTFGYFIEITELLVGVALIIGPLVWLFAWQRTSERSKVTVLLLTAIAGIGGIFMAINFHLANGDPHPWLLPESGFDEGVDLDSIIPAIQGVIVVVTLIYYSRLRRRVAETLA